VLGTGGFVCGPVILAAASLGIPSIIHESNLVPGLTNRLLAGAVTFIAVGHAETCAHFPAPKTVVIGFPLRPDLNRATREQGCAAFGLDPARRVLFVFPGSLAARRINRAVAEALPQLTQRLPDLQVLWMTGSADLGMARNVAEKLSLPVVIREFIHEVPEAYAAADLVLARAGAGTLAELSALGKPALLVPYPYATGDHQTYNAGLLVRAGAAAEMTDAECSGGVLLGKLLELFERQAGLEQAAAAVRAAYPQDAAEVLARKMIELAQKKGRKGVGDEA
jgi:UDP-N-acetylglucosamine--N-acetylmuramyl-(pentapeptide) pyrophosphoryl-undecaprenol N-acetylglucosamine transferase